MLGRTANDLFWLSRYVERAENMARLVEVGYRIVLLSREEKTYHQEWRSTLASAGCEAGYFAKRETLEAREVINFLLFDADNPASVRSCLTTARRNARTQRTALTREMWESLNGSWIEFQGIRPQSLSSDALPKLLGWIRERSAAYRGALLNTILRNDTFHFSQLGTFVERADNTARILDVKYYILLPSSEMVGSGVDNVQWEAILRSVSAHRSYRWVYKASYRAWRIAEYLILNRAMPRSLRACYGEIAASLMDLARLYGEAKPCHATAQATLDLLETGDINTIFQSGLHEFLLDFVARNNRLGLEISDAYHFNS
ncbi:MAG TPA: alpha-E domain-containing protein [Hyphomicrobiaceae bacterium]|nr:alpha-E domain-containing protein [Hyphomicrobiaceae bacterium]